MRIAESSAPTPNTASTTVNFRANGVLAWRVVLELALVRDPNLWQFG